MQHPMRRLKYIDISFNWIIKIYLLERISLKRFFLLIQFGFEKH